MIVVSITLLNVTQTTGRLLYDRRYSLISLASLTNGPLYLFPRADCGREFFRLGREITCENKSRARTIRSPNGSDCKIRQLNSRIDLCNCRIVPLAEFAHVNVYEHFARELEI